jgi:tetratricopeptide (TPR) repeat protein
VPDQDRANGAPVSPVRGDQNRRKADKRPDTRLDTWKEIGAFFGRDERTVKRWEATRGLPVHRVPGSGRATVYAYVGELERWLESADAALVEPLSGKPPMTPQPSAPDPPPTPGTAPIAAEIAPPLLETTLSADRTEAESFAPAPAPPPPIAPILPAAKHHSSRRNLYIAAILLTAAAMGVAGYRFRAASSQSPSRAAKHTVNAEAQEFYLKGEYYLQKRTPESLNLAVDNYTQAIVHDPGYAQAYAGLADCYNLLREYTAMPDREAYPRALAAAKQAIALDDSLSSAHSALAFVNFFWLRDVPAAEQEFKRALELDPNSISARHWYATYLLHVGRYRESLTQINYAQTLDPSSTSILSDKGLILAYNGHDDQALTLLRQLETAEPTFLSPRNYLAKIYLDRGNYRGFLDEATEAAHLLENQDRLAIMRAAAEGFHQGGANGMFEAMLARQIPLYEANRQPAFYLAETCARLGREREALDYLRISLDRREPEVIGIRMATGLNSLHKDPEFRKILSEMGFPPLED